MMPQSNPTKAKIHPLVWILAGLAAVVVLLAVAVVVGGLLLVNKAREAGVDAEMFRKNPAVAITKMVTAMNPDAEILSVDEGRGMLVVRDKRTGKTVTLRFDDVRNGKVTIEGDDKQEVIVTGGAGTDVKLPRWVPRYPGAAAKATVSVQNPDQDTGNVTLTTSDDPRAVLDFYEKEFQKEAPAWKTSLTRSSDGGVIHASDENTERTVTVAVGRSGSDTAINLTFTRK
jgi:hypothetical protein